MAKYRIRTIQVFKTIRSIEIEVEAKDENDALEGASSGAIDTPEFDDPNWKTSCDLQNEEVEPACPSPLAPTKSLAMPSPIFAQTPRSFPMTTLETRRFAVISTAHVSETTAKRLDNTPPKEWPCLGGPYGEYGWFLYAHDENAGGWPDAIPDELFNVMTWARRQGFAYILLDCDADHVEELPTFDW